MTSVVGKALSSFDFAGSQATGTNMQPLCSAVYLALNALYIGVPDCVASSMRMAYIITEMNALATNITLSHFDTSSTLKYLLFILFTSR